MNNPILYTLAFLTILHLPSSRCDVLIVKQIYVSKTVYPCEYNYDPVCGSDGITYINSCLLEFSNNNNQNKTNDLTPIIPLDDSKCTGCNCQNIDLPVCTLDGTTYRNECELSCENIKRIQQKQPIIYLAYRAACIGPPCGCPTIASPVCGSNNVLYRNQCVLECTAANAQIEGLYPIKFKNVGGCLDACQCPKKVEPVCGSDSAVYDNLCQLACKNKFISHSNNPVVTEADKSVCAICNCPRPTSLKGFVCGGDGNLEPKTYENPCHLECDAKRSNNPYLKVISQGPCPKCYCTDFYSPVCGTDRKTYRNLCLLRCANDGLPEGKQSLGIFYYGECKNDYCDCSYCPNEYQPMCGSNKVTYWNLCWLNCNSDCNKKQGLAEIFLARRGSCSL